MPICNPSHRARYHLGTFLILSHLTPGFVCPLHSLTQNFWVSVRGKVHNRLATATAWKELFTVPSQFLVFWSKYVWSLLKGLVTLTKTLISRVCFAFCNVCHNLKGMHVGSQKVWESTHTASYRIFRQEFWGFQPVWKHCQRHNGPEGWVLLTKVTSSYTNIDQIPKFKISTKHQHFDQTLTSKSWPNNHFITSPRLSSKILTKLHFQNFAWT